MSIKSKRFSCAARVIFLALALVSCLSTYGQSATLAWAPSASANVAGYSVAFGTDGSNFTNQQDAGFNTVAIITNLQAGATYYFEVSAYDSAGTFSAPSSAVTFTVPFPPLMLTVNANPANAGILAGGGGIPTGNSATVTATASSGFTFSNWTCNGAVISLSPSYNFLMTSNTALVANFTANPVIYTVTASSGGNGSITPNGPQTASAGGSLSFTALAANGYQINQWFVNGVQSQNQGSSFTLLDILANAAVSVTFSPIPSNNTNNISTNSTNSNSTTSTNSTNNSSTNSSSTGSGTSTQNNANSNNNSSSSNSQTNVNTSFSLLISGNGALTPYRNGQTFANGKKFNLTAIAGKGSIFDNWVSNGVAVSITPTYSFIAESNLTIEALFIPNPYTPAAGIYRGLFFDTNVASIESSGAFQASVTTAGTYSALIRFSSATYGFVGKFSPDGAAAKTIYRYGLSPLTVQLQLGFTNSQITGTITDGTWTANLTANTAGYSRQNPAPQAGRYTLVIPGSTNTFTQPGGNGIGAATVDALGNVTLSGLLGDGTLVSAASVLSSNGDWPLFASLYGGRGSILGWLSITNSGGPGGQVAWFKLAQPANKEYPAGFAASAQVIGSSYQHTNNLPPLGYANDLVTFNGGNLPQSFASPADATANSQAHAQNATKITFIAATGMFLGTAVDPDTGKPIAFHGVVMQDEALGAGFFTGTTQTGSILLTQANSP